MLKRIFFQSIILNFVFFSVAQSAESTGMPQLNPEFWFSQIFWLIITFGIMFVLLSKFVLPKISENLEVRKAQILENIDAAEKQREESDKKLKEYEKLIFESKIEAKNYFNKAREKILKDVNKKKENIEKEINDEINKAEKEILDLKNKSPEKIRKIAVETSSDLINKLIVFEKILKTLIKMQIKLSMQQLNQTNQ